MPLVCWQALLQPQQMGLLFAAQQQEVSGCLRLKKEALVIVGQEAGAPCVVSAASFLLMFPHKRHINCQPIRFPHRFIGGDDAAKDVGEGPLWLHSRIGFPEVKQE